MWTGMRAALLLIALGSASAVTPIEKVIGLLKDLQAKVEKQGAKEAAQYNAFACFCKDQAEAKAASIEKSEEKLEVLEADIKDLEGEIASLDEDVADLSSDIKTLKSDISDETEKREKAHAEYLVKEKDLQEAIDACGEAIEALQNSKKSIAKGGGDVDLMQLKTAAFNAKVSQNPEALKEALSLVRTARKAAFESTGESEKPQKFKYQSNEIIATIQELQATFKENKKELDTDEFEAKDESEKKLLGWSNEQSFKEKESAEKSALSESKTEEKVSTEAERDTETSDKESDETFKTTVEEDCKKKAEDWDQRSTARAEEIAALSEATETLEGGALKQYNANKKLTGFIAKAPVDVPAPEKPAEAKKADDKKAKPSPSFLQIRSVANAQAAAVRRVVEKIDSAATRLHSPILAALAVKVQLKEDHFANVRALIKDLVSKLEADAEAEADQKGFCDTQMAEATKNRDEGNLNIEEQSGIIAKNEAKAAELAEEIATLAKEIAALNKALLEATDLRNEESASNKATIEEAQAGADAVKSALETLETVYGKAALMQYTPPKADRHGRTVGDVSPDAFSGEYDAKSNDEAKGILGILQVVHSDFERTVTKTKEEEEEAAKEFKEFKEDSEKNIKEKTESKADKTKEKDTAEANVIEAKDNLKDAQDLLASAEAELEKLSPMCVQGEETYAERVAAREKEIAALKEAMQILDDAFP